MTRKESCMEDLPFALPPASKQPKPISGKRAKTRASAAKADAGPTSPPDVPGGVTLLPGGIAAGSLNDIFGLLQSRGLNITPRQAAKARRRAAEVARYEAQELAFRAMQTARDTECAALCRRALALDPDCADALVCLAQAEKAGDEEYEQRVREAVAAGERALGKKVFAELRGHFWGFMETRPYMRARMELARLLQNSGRDAEALTHLEEMLELNTDDNNGLRYGVVALHLRLHRPERAAFWLERYRNDESAFFVWAIVLLRLAGEDSAGALQALAAARRSNPHAEPYLSGAKKLPRKLPEYYGFGDENEGVLAADTLASAYDAFPAARSWLAAQAPVESTVTVPKRAPRRAGA